MSNSNPDVNAAFAAYKSADNLSRPKAETALLKSLEKYAAKIVWLKLHRNDPDIVHEAVQLVMAQLPNFEGRSRFSTFVFVVVERHCYAAFLRQSARKETLFSELPEYKVERLGNYYLDGDAKVTLDRLRKALSKDENLLIELRLQGYTHAEIAQKTATTSSAVESRWRRLCEKLRQTETNNTRPSRTKTTDLTTDETRLN